MTIAPAVPVIPTLPNEPVEVDEPFTLQTLSIVRFEPLTNNEPVN